MPSRSLEGAYLLEQGLLTSEDAATLVPAAHVRIAGDPEERDPRRATPC
jgi:hypothetical protein